MSFEDRMIEAVERGYATDETAYEYVRESLADLADRRRDERRLGESRDEAVGPLGRLPGLKPQGGPLPCPPPRRTGEDPA